MDGHEENFDATSEITDIPEGGVFRLTAEIMPVAGATTAFLHWAGDLTQSQAEEQPNPLHIEMDDGKTVED